MLAMAMIDVVIVCAVIIFGNADGRRPSLPPLPKKDGCLRVSPDVEVFRVKGEAVILQFPQFWSVLQVRNLLSPSAQISITKKVNTEDEAYLDKRRVQQNDKQMWFLPADVSDSGEYICKYRNDSFCVAGSITLHVFASYSENMYTLSYPVSLIVGENLKFRCPSISYFNAKRELITWSKVDSESSFYQEGGRLIIPAVTRSHAGFYICRLPVQINNQRYNVSRAVLLRVQDFDSPTITQTPGDFTTTDVENSSTVIYPEMKDPTIVSPINATIYEIVDDSIAMWQVAVVAASGIFTVICVFLCMIFKPNKDKKMSLF